MCGIAGLMTVSAKGPQTSLLDVFAKALAHRGPDGSGRHVSGNLAMVHTRLAIIDVEGGAQPLTDSGGAALIANGEIYNYLELRKEFDDIDFTTQSDCEVPLHLYRRLGTGFAQHLRGMYAIAIHDPAQGRLVLSRDPFGIKPLYYVENDLGLAFASEPHALIEAGMVKAELNPASRDELIQLQFTTGAETPIKEIRRVLPGETLVVVGGRIVERQRIEALPEMPEQTETDHQDDEEALLLRLDAALEDSVRVHQCSDVPYGMFLSGGIDSSVLLALMARLGERPIKAYTVGFPGSKVADERAHARHLASLVGAEHVEIDFEEDDFWALLPVVAARVDDPVADYAILPTWKLAREAGRDLKVILSGEGGDELFAGYGRYRSVMRPFWRGGRILRRHGILDGFGVLRNPPNGWRDGIAAAGIAAKTPHRSALQIAQATDIADWLPNDLLIKLDRCLMAHSVEGRTPFLDPRLAAEVFNLPDNMKVRRGMGKWLLRRWLDKYLPQAEPFSPKRGFTVPVSEWIEAQGKRLGPMVAAAPGVAEICNEDAVRALFMQRKKRSGFACWTLLFYALWHRANILQLEPEGDVFDTLSAF
ncbi:MAG: asparagine synthase (glutamine-hydrolyzing) [Rhodospirillaceae bacterium]|jgi:asparagine synthase (glutamine-hydrolysing)|nr:asparagine synthase (glutamine-hydrolyzing) [Rhodospirillaceae bacterium]